jgi:hypothetical protein
MKPDLPPLRGLDQNAGDVEAGVIGGRKRTGPTDQGMVVAIMIVAIGAVTAVGLLISWWWV